MKIRIFFVTVLFACMTVQGCTAANGQTEESGTDSSNKELTIFFDFQRGGIASSQYAIWIENEEGKLVRTLYATSFTAKGGYEYRRDAIPFWVGKACPEKMTDTQVDAITGATPGNGKLTYIWDGTDQNGTRVPKGKYHFFIEGTLYWKSRVLFSGTVNLGGAEQVSIPIETRYFNWSTVNKDMISSIKVSYRQK